MTPVLAVDVSPAPAAEAQVARPTGEAPVAVATRRVDPIRIDGNLDEAAWRSAVPIVPLTQRDPLEGQPATEATEVRILFDGDALHFGIACRDKTPSAIVWLRDLTGRYVPAFDRATGEDSIHGATVTVGSCATGAVPMINP